MLFLKILNNRLMLVNRMLNVVVLVKRLVVEFDIL